MLKDEQNIFRINLITSDYFWLSGGEELIISNYPELTNPELLLPKNTPEK